MENTVAQQLVTALRNSGISFVSYLPETRLSQMIPLLQQDSAFRVVPTTSESEAVSIAAGAALTGNQAAVYMEGTGVYVSAYSLFTIGERFGIPMLLLEASTTKETAPLFRTTPRHRNCSRRSALNTNL
jgi:sulfopyruvate decarboxylase subunit alpha